MIERFDQYMDRCLYDPVEGFYGGGRGRAGRRRGDFITSPEVGPLFADVLAEALDAWWDDLDRPDPFRVFDAGTGPGTLARTLEQAGGRSAPVRVVDGFDHGPVPDDLTGAVVIANEVLDNIPFRVIERTAVGWSEVWVESDSSAAGSDAPSEILRPLHDKPAALALLDGVDDLVPGRRVPLVERAAGWIESLLEAGAAIVVAFDYGTATTRELGERGGWLRTYCDHTVADDPYREPGRWDITTDVPLDQLRPPDAVTTQAGFLRRWGIDELVEAGRRHWQAHAARPDLHALRMRSRVSEADALLDPNGLGSWLVCEWRVGPAD